MADASARLHALAQGLHELPRSAMVKVAKQAKAIAEEEGRKAGSPMLKGKVKLSASTQIESSGDVTTLTMHGIPVGPWVWVTSGTKPHSIPRQRGGAKARYLHAQRYEHPIRTPPSIKHPGTSGGGAWDKVAKRVAKEAPQVFVEELRKVVA